MFFVVSITAAFAVARFLVPVRGLDPRDSYKDAAHLWVGGLFGAAVMATCRTSFEVEEEHLIGRITSLLLSALMEWEWWFLPLGLTLVEVVAFVVRKPKQGESKCKTC